MMRVLGEVARQAQALSRELRCPTDDWPVLAHDAARSSASRECCSAPFRPAFRFAPPAKDQRPARAHHAVVSGDAIYVSGVIGQSPAVWRVSRTGALEWTFDSRVDITRQHWPAVVLDRVVLNDDGLYILDPRTGEREVDRGLDAWGQVLTDGKNLFANNTWHIAGPKVRVAAMESGGAPLWTRNEYGVEREDVLDRVGGIALGGGALIQSADFRPSPGSGLFVFETADGKLRWSADSIPRNQASVVGEQVVVAERRETGRVPAAIVARRLRDGDIAWEKDANVRDAVPIAHASGLLLSREAPGRLVARSAEDGEERWGVALAEAPDRLPLWSTNFAIAGGSAGVVAVSGSELVIVALRDGAIRARAPVADAKAPVHSPVIARGLLLLVDEKGVLALHCDPG